MSLGIITRVSGKGSEYHGHAAQAPSSFHVAAEIVAGALQALALDFGDEQGRSKKIEHFAGVGRVTDGDHVVAFVFEGHFEGFAARGVGVRGEAAGLFRGVLGVVDWSGPKPPWSSPWTRTPSS